MLKVAAPHPRAFLCLGCSVEVLEGETVLAIGNPGDRVLPLQIQAMGPGGPAGCGGELL